MFPQTFIDKTLELIIDRGPMPFHAPGGRQQEAHPLTNSHRDVLRMLQKQGAVKIEYEGDELMVSYSGPPVPDKMFAALRSLPDRAIYVVPTEQRRQMARLSLVVSQRLAGDDRRIMIALMPGARREVAEGEFFLTAEGEKFMPRLMAFNRPIFMDHRCIKSAASTLALRTYMDGLPAAYGERSIEPTIRPDRWKYGDPARFHKAPPASGTRSATRQQWKERTSAARIGESPSPIYPPPIAAYSPRWDYATNPVASLHRDMQNAFAGMTPKPYRLTARERLDRRRQRAAERRKIELRRLAYHAPRHRIWRHWITVGTLGGIVLLALLVAVFP